MEGKDVVQVQVPPPTHTVEWIVAGCGRFGCVVFVCTKCNDVWLDCGWAPWAGGGRWCLDAHLHKGKLESGGVVQVQSTSQAWLDCGWLGQVWACGVCMHQMKRCVVGLWLGAWDRWWNVVFV